MKGHIRQRSKRSWAVVVDAGKNPDTGRRTQHWHTIQGTKRDAQRFLNELLVSLEKGTYVKPARLTLGDWLTQWFNSYVIVHTTARTQESYGSIIRQHIIPALGAVPLDSLRPHHLEGYYGKALDSGRTDGRGGLSARSVLYHHRILSEALGHAVKMGIVARNAAAVVDPPRPARIKMATLSTDEISRFLEAARQTSHYVFFAALLCTGLRRGELLALRWRNLDLEQAVIHVVETAFKLGNGDYVIKEPKTPHSRRAVSLPASLVSLLLVYRIDRERKHGELESTLSEDDFVFSGHDGSPLNPNTITLAFRRIIGKAGLGHLRVHDLRHTHATLMLKAGVHPKVVSERLGHASVSITLDTYSHVLPGLQEAAVERFDEVLALANENSETNVSKMFANKEEGECRPCRSRTCDPD